MNRELLIVDRKQYLKTLNNLESDSFFTKEFRVLGLNSIFYLEVKTRKVLAQSLYFPGGINEYRINIKFKENNE